ncbi:hypothetical protein PTSG_09776 [Salpingoeca rosetta]|uniref:Ubiquitin carboxyl-terminal hydrolase n=1 Tax=Salpingoeca rosetta (strain ATCC 50818 / BSB-021) TaxID=946362 RepID=F2UP11_SALR5|nr:uncharacterized protein PTSG_09776 [Salpingoeca rosetta]EGD79366.1 hypothetical protein PTSG_09776 [Salpingoeca rosetta]|eukprot:XP_004989135.1 hypothetical protein PTSG_09776 [Salpingoeca rosetta]
MEFSFGDLSLEETSALKSSAAKTSSAVKFTPVQMPGNAVATSNSSGGGGGGITFKTVPPRKQQQQQQQPKQQQRQQAAPAAVTTKQPATPQQQPQQRTPVITAPPSAAKTGTPASSQFPGAAPKQRQRQQQRKPSAATSPSPSSSTSSRAASTSSAPQQKATKTASTSSDKGADGNGNGNGDGDAAPATSPTEGSAPAAKPKLTKRQQQQQRLRELQRRKKKTGAAPGDATVEPHYAMHGILNEGNTCYMNAPLQLLFSLPHVRRVLLGASVPPSTLTYALQSFLREFISTSRLDVLDPRQDVDRILRVAKPLSAAAVYAGIGSRNPSLFDFSNMQHDAEEVLTFLLSTVHDELLKHCPTFTGLAPGERDASGGARNADDADADAGDDAGDDGWEEVGPKKTSARLNEVKAKLSAVSRVLQGTFRSTIAYKSGQRSIVLQPFFVLQVDIKPETKRLEEAIDATFSPETIEGVQRSGAPAAVTARKQLHLERAPPVLLIQLKRYHFDGQQITKLTNHVDFTETLTLKQSWLSVKAQAEQECEYHLHGVVFHIGSLAVQGHYTCSVRSSCGWLDFNDKKIKRIDPMFVYRPAEREQAYMLAYVRKDALHLLDYR